MKASVIALAAAVLLASPAVAQEEGEQSEKKSPKICKVDRATGSLTRRTKICMTKEEWRALNTQTRDNIDSYSSRMGNREGAGQAGG